MLLNASPDLRSQIEATPELHPRGLRGTPIEGVVLTSGDLDQVLGLLLLRELTPLRIYSSASVRRIVREDNAFFHMLSQNPEQSRWTDICPQQPFAPLPGLCCRAISVGRRLSALGPRGSWTHAQPGGVRVWTDLGMYPRAPPKAMTKPGESSRIAYMPAIASYTDELLAELDLCDVVLLDGTFWSDDELQRVDPAARTARQMGHVPLGGPGGVLEVASGLRRPRKIFVHINNTNPILDEDSPQFAEVKSAGWEVAKDGWTLGC